MVRIGADDALFIDSKQEECLQRLADDGERPYDAWAGYVSEWFEAYQPD
jgi:hypothetical protein